MLVLAGDIGLGDQGVRWAAGQAERLGVPCVYVAGNHEYYGRVHERVQEAMHRAAEGTGVHVLDDASVSIGGVRFVGATLWTGLDAHNPEQRSAAKTMIEMSMADYRVIGVDEPGRTRPRMLRADDTIAWHEASVAFLQRTLGTPFDGPTVVVTHHGPSAACQRRDMPLDWITNGFWSPLERLFDPQAVDLWVFGHTHASLDTHVRGVHLVSNQGGYPGEPVPGGFDPARTFGIGPSPSEGGRRRDDPR